MGMEMYDKIKRMVEADIEELVAKGSLEPCEYQALGEAIDIVKDVCKIKMMKMEEGEMMPEEDMRSYGMPRYNMRMSNDNRGGSQDGSYGSYAMGYPYDKDSSYYNPNRSPRTGRYTSNDGSYDRAWEIRESHHDKDGTMKQDLQELLNNAKTDHERMLIMRVMGKLEQ